MNCLKPEEIQMYLDGEMTFQTRELLDDHLKKCDLCRQHVEEHRSNIVEVIQQCEQMWEEQDIAIPPFIPPKHKSIKRIVLPRWWAAAIILPLAVGISLLKKPNPTESNIPEPDQFSEEMIMDMLYEPDLNAQWQSGEAPFIIVESFKN